VCEEFVLNEEYVIQNKGAIVISVHKMKIKYDNDLGAILAKADGFLSSSLELILSAIINTPHQFQVFYQQIY